MNYLLFVNPISGSPILTELIKKGIKPKVVVTTCSSIDSWKRIFYRKLKNQFTVEDKLRYFHKIPFYDYRMLNRERIKKINSKHKIDIGFITTFSYIIPQEFINLFPKGIYNFHPSLLPKHGGANAFFWVIYSNDRYTGTTCHQVTNVLDHGHILLQKQYLVNNMNARELFKCYIKDISEMVQSIMSNYLQLYSDSREMGVTEYDPQKIPELDFSDKRIDRDIILRYKRAIKRLV